jgi:putative flippase GtrA
MDLQTPWAGPVPGAGPTPVLDLVIPVYNEAAGLACSVRTVSAFLRDSFPYSARITIADNASTDGTLAIAHELAAELDGVRVLHLDQKGRGRALQRSWLGSDAQVLAYMDVDLSTDLAALLPLVAPLVSGHSHVAIGSRLSRTSRVTRGPKRELISRAYNLLVRGTLRARFSDAQCGFKAIRADVAHELLPLVEDDGWFFDTEVLVLAERAGLRIHEVPVDWVDDPDSRVDIVATALADIRGIVRLGRDLASGRLPLAEARAQILRDAVEERPVTLLAQLARFVVVGVLSTLAYALLYLILCDGVGAQSSNLLALLITAVLNTAANRRVTFGVRGRDAVWRHQGRGLLVFGLAWALTAGSLVLLHAVVPGAPRGVELAVLVVANLGATVLRFVLLRGWVFRVARRGATAPPEAAPPIAAGSPSPKALGPLAPAVPDAVLDARVSGAVSGSPGASPVSVRSESALTGGALR